MRQHNLLPVQLVNRYASLAQRSVHHDFLPFSPNSTLFLFFRNQNQQLINLQSECSVCILLQLNKFHAQFALIASQNSSSKVNFAQLRQQKYVSSLSDVEIKKLFETVNRLKKQGISFIFVSHRLQEVLTLSDRIYILKDGRLTKELYPENTTEDEIVMNMVGRSYDDYYKRKRVYFGKEVLRIENYSGIDNKVLARNAHTPRNISLQLNEGEVLGIAGLVGAGRTELLRLIFGEDKKESGECFLCGERVNIRRCKDAYDLGMAWVTEDRKNEGLIQKFDLKTNIALPIQSLVRKGLFVDVTKENAIADEFIENLHVKTTGRSQQARFLSGGNQQKVVLAKWLASNPRILVLDEPTRGIDVSAKAEIYALINNLTAQGMAILLVSSELPEIMGISDRIIVMHDGEITGEFQREEFSEQSIMTCAIGRRKE